jgi:hypothetical protein
VSVLYYHDDFNNGVVDCRIDSPNGRGVVSESTSLYLASTAGQDCDWWYTVSRRGALAYMPIASLTKVGTWYLEETVSAINLAGNTYGYLHCLIYDGTRMVWMGCQGTGPSYSFSFNYWNGADSNIGSFSTTLPVKLRYVWVKSTNIVTGYSWGPGDSDWVSRGSYTMPWTPVWYGAGIKNWSGQQFGSANLSQMDISYDLLPAANYKTFDRAGEYNTGVGDLPVLRTLQGPTQQSQPSIGRGLVLNERSANAGAITTPTLGGAGAGESDSYVFRTLTGQQQHDQPRVGQGYVLNERGGYTGGLAAPAVGDGSVGMSDPYVTRLQNALYQLGGVDSEGHAYFNGYDHNVCQVINNANAPWHTPTLNNFSGYARDGKKYTNGVQDAGPVWAPWASEAAGAHRSLRADFPVKAAFVATNSEISVFDLDNYPTVKLWMRFNVGSSDNWVMIGSTVRRPSCIEFWNGQLCVGHSGSDGYLAAVDFKATTAPIAYLIGASNPCFVWTTGKTIVDRNVWNFTTTGGIAGLYMGGSLTWYELATYHDGTDLYVAAATSRGPCVFHAWDWYTGFAGIANGACTAICFDRHQTGRASSWGAGVLFYAIGSVIYRNRREYRSGSNQVISDGSEWLRRRVKSGPTDFIDLGTGVTVNYLVPGPPYIYAATNQGIYRIHQSTLAAELRYSTADGMGTYKVIPGTRRNVLSLRSFTLISNSTFLAVARPASGQYRGGVAILRDKDGALLGSWQSPTLPMLDGSGAVEMFTYA